MLIPSDYKDLLRLLNKHRARYLLVGAYAVIYYTEPRYTKDLDIWVEPEANNAGRVYRALKEFGAPLKDIDVFDFRNKNLVYQIGMAPIRVDILMNISGVEFKKAWKHKKTATFEGIKVNIIGMKELMSSKKETNRPTDRLDVSSLKSKRKLK